MSYTRNVVAGALIVTFTVVLAFLALSAAEYERTLLYEASEANLLNEHLTQPPPGCTVNEDGSATCQDEQGGWHFDVSPW